MDWGFLPLWIRRKGGCPGTTSAVSSTEDQSKRQLLHRLRPSIFKSSSATAFVWIDLHTLMVRITVAKSMKQGTGYGLTVHHCHRHHWSCIIAIAPSVKTARIQKPGQMGLKTYLALSIKNADEDRQSGELKMLKHRRWACKTWLASDHQHANIATEAMDPCDPWKTRARSWRWYPLQVSHLSYWKLKRTKFQISTRRYWSCHWAPIIGEEWSITIYISSLNVRPLVVPSWLCGSK